MFARVLCWLKGHVPREEVLEVVPAGRHHPLNEYWLTRETCERCGRLTSMNAGQWVAHSVVSDSADAE